MNVEFKDSRLVKFEKIYVYIFFFGYSKPVVNVRNISQSRFSTFYAYIIIKQYYVLQGSFFLFKLPWVTWDNQMVFRNRI